MLRNVVGVDVGGSKTHVCILDERANFLGEGFGGPGNPNFTPASEVRASLEGAARSALGASGEAGRQIEVGAVGGPCPPEHFEPALRAVFGQDLRMIRAGEGPITLAAGSRDLHGIVVVAGTGSLAWGRNREGRTHFASGWGSLLGDEGSAYDIAVQALRAACRSADGRGQPTSLLDRYLATFGLRDARQIVGRVYQGGMDRRAIAATCPIVFEAARTGDEVASRILRRAARELALGALTCARVLDMAGDTFDVVASGGVLRADDHVMPALRALILRRCPGARITRPLYAPAVGAALLALREVGVALDQAAFARLDDTLRSRAVPTGIAGGLSAVSLGTSPGTTEGRR